MTVVKIKPDGSTETSLPERGKEKEKAVIVKKENLIIRMISIIIMDIKKAFGRKYVPNHDIETRVDQWRKEVSRRKK